MTYSRFFHLVCSSTPLPPKTNKHGWTFDMESVVLTFFASHEELWNVKHPEYIKRNGSHLLDQLAEKLDNQFDGK